jgi:hypothetical protein|tara:strand:+ start:462 stop:794 length:333 start_codon:yes stop_codon:yes gene_type:complete
MYFQNETIKYPYNYIKIMSLDSSVKEDISEKQIRDFSACQKFKEKTLKAGGNLAILLGTVIAIQSYSNDAPEAYISAAMLMGGGGYIRYLASTVKNQVIEDFYNLIPVTD